jgi:GTP-binding protein
MRRGYEDKLVSHRLLSKKLMVKNVSQLKLTIDLPENLSGRAVEFVTMRKGEMLSMETKGERMIVKFNTSRGIIGLRNQLLQLQVRLLWHTVL